MQGKAPVSVVIARFEDLVARGLQALLEEDASVEILDTDVEHERLAAVLLAHAPDVAIVNFGSLQSPAQVRRLRSSHPATQIVLLANHPSGAECAQMLAFGASACLGKATQARDIVGAVHLASRGLQLFPRVHRSGEDDGAEESELLTLREAEVLGMLRDGRLNAEIADELQISIETVRTHARNIYRKLGVSSRRELVAGRVGGVLKQGPWGPQLVAAPQSSER
ncbi:MAG: helix-turn-helix transcriptional regulator [Solirubrobacteraceae bacterium]